MEHSVSKSPLKRSKPTKLRLETLEHRIVPAGDIVLQWNDIASQACTVDLNSVAPQQGGPTKASRVLAIVQTAVYDAVDAIDGTYSSYLGDNIVVPKGASITAAVSQAAHDALVAMYSNQKSYFDSQLTAILATLPADQSRQDGLSVGSQAAAVILAARAGDHAADPAPYTPTGNVGDWAPDPTHPGQKALTPGWGNVTPFTMTTGSEFRAPSPPALGSAEYAAAYNEVKALGGNGTTTPTIRTAEQTQIGIFWAYDGTPGICTPPRLYNQILEQIAIQNHNTVVQNARLFAMANLAMADAGIAGWETKYYYNLWRPITAIRNGANDGNSATTADTTWTPLGAPYSNGTNGASDNFTPPFPTYVSGHATFGGALFETLKNFYGTDAMSFTLKSDELNGITTDSGGAGRPKITRSFTSFSQAADENAISRVYLGIHYRFDATEGVKQGSAIADNAFSHFLKSKLTPDQRYVTQLYRDLLNRDPDSGGQSNWVNILGTGQSRTVVSNAFTNSTEFRSIRINDFYREFLKRSADPTGMSHFLDVLNRGGTFDTIRGGILGSAEYFQNRAGSSKDAFVGAVYLDMLGRGVDVTTEANSVIALNNGLSRDKLILNVCASNEFCSIQVGQIYTTNLNRSADPSGLQGWVSQLLHGQRFETVLGGILASSEYSFHG